MRAVGLTDPGNVRVMVNRPAVAWGLLVRPDPCAEGLAKLAARTSATGRRRAASPGARVVYTTPPAPVVSNARPGRKSYIRSIMALPKPEQDTCVAPGIKRAKS